MKKQTEKDKLTALYERLSHDDDCFRRLLSEMEEQEFIQTLLLNRKQ